MPGGLAGAGSWAGNRHADPVIADPGRGVSVSGDHTAVGLPVRVPRANLLPGSAGGGRAAQVPAPPQRSPELVRSRLTGFQGGIRRAMDQASGTGEENGR